MGEGVSNDEQSVNGTDLAGKEEQAGLFTITQTRLTGDTEALLFFHYRLMKGQLRIHHFKSWLCSKEMLCIERHSYLRNFAGAFK